MKEQQFVFDFLDVLRNSVPDKYTVRTDGGDADATPPLCILKWNTTGSSVGGHSPYAGTIRDENGDAIGRELHRYGRMECEITIRSYDEGERDTVGPSISDDLVPFMYDSDLFNEDTFEWAVGEFKPKSFSVVERDWYEGFVTVSCGYVRRVEQMADTLQDVQENIDG